MGTENSLVICNMCEQGSCANYKWPQPLPGKKDVVRAIDSVTGEEYVVSFPIRRRRIRSAEVIDRCIKKEMAARERGKNSG